MGDNYPMHSPGFEDGDGTLLSHFAEDVKIGGAVVPPLFQNSLFLFDRTEDLLDALSGHQEDGRYIYSRSGNPTVEVIERKLAALEGTDACKFTGGGISAITLALSNELESGAHVVMVDTAYSPARSYLGFMARFGVSNTLVEGSSVEEVLDAVRPETRVIYLESPSSMLFRMQDVPVIAKAARHKGIVTMFDNTYNTPLYMNPASFGIDVVLHSASKYLGGHSDLNGGAICTDSARMARIAKGELSYYAGLMHPFTAWLVLRGMRTLKVRIQQHERTANEIASWLEQRPEVDRVHHVSLSSYPQRDLYRKLLRGSTGLFSFEPKVQDRDRIMGFCDALRLFGRGISWGGFESLVVPVQVRSESDEKRWLIRLFCGLEEVADLRKDLENALAHIAV
jgi:cystathionine beta-lyase